MNFMYTVFFDASVVAAILATVTYFFYALSNYRAAQAFADARKGSKGRSHLKTQPALALQGASPVSRIMNTVTHFMSSQVDQIGKSPASATAVAISGNRDFEVADSSLPVTPESIALGHLGTTLISLMSFSLVMTMIFRTILTQHAPWSNMYEASIAVAGFLSIAYIIFEVRYQSRALGVFSSLFVLLLLLFAIWVGNAFNQAQPLQFNQITPALQDNPILAIHVSFLLLSYAFFMVSFACAVVMLIQGDGSVSRYSWLPHSRAADELGYRAVTIGFPLLALGIILGAYWANYAWGHYWSWDPKETSALITWLVYAIYLHMRGLRGMRGKTTAWVLVAAFGAVLFTYLGVSFIIPGLHSYSGVK